MVGSFAEERVGSWSGGTFIAGQDDSATVALTRSRRADRRPAGYRRAMSELATGDTGRDREALLHSPLHAEHVALGATMGAFGGWDMPISYAGAGVVAEHTAVRTAVGIFDVSHLGKALVSGPGAAAFVNDCLTADLAKIGPGRRNTRCAATPTAASSTI